MAERDNSTDLQGDSHEMGKRGAARNNSGLPVDHSGPDLGVGPTTPATAGRKPEACPPGSLSQGKSGWGSGGEAPSSASEAKQPTSLDQIQNNRNSGRGRHCGRFSIRGADQHSRAVHFRRVNCKCWYCPYCGPRKAKRYKHAIRITAEAHGLSRFLTLTLDPKKIQGDSVRYLNATFAKLRVYWKRRYGVAPTYIRILEFQKNGNPHLHILIDRFIEQAWIQAAWSAIGGGQIVDIRYVDLHRISRYLSKYLTKELLLSAPLRTRRVTTSRGITLLQKTPAEITWVLVRIPIWRLFEVYAAWVLSCVLDEEDVLEAFSVATSSN